MAQAPSGDDSGDAIHQRALRNRDAGDSGRELPTKIFLANPDMNRDVYREAFHLNDTELDLIDGLVPPGQMLIRKAQTSKKVHLNVDSVSHWMATNMLATTSRSRKYFDRHGFCGWPSPSRGKSGHSATRAGRINFETTTGKGALCGI